MKPNEVDKDIIGKRCKCAFFGRMVTGTIEDAAKNKKGKYVTVRFDRPQQWNNRVFDMYLYTGRADDDPGTLDILDLIDKYDSCVFTFGEDIGAIDERFAWEHDAWGAVNLKEWIDLYESTRFSQFDGRRAVITSGYNMEHVMKWLPENTKVVSQHRPSEYLKL